MIEETKVEAEEVKASEEEVKARVSGVVVVEIRDQPLQEKSLMLN